MADDSKSIPLLSLVVEFLVVIAVGLCILYLFLTDHAYHRGFYCDDESLRHPYKDSTVPSYYLYIFGLGCNLIAIVAGEYLNRDKSQIKVSRWTMRKWTFDVYRTFIIFCFGAACSQLITDSLKYIIGRLRPHFYLLCAPRFKNGQNCDAVRDFHLAHEYIVTYECSNPHITKRQEKEMRLSFPSGHSSFAMYTMLFFALYVGARCRWTNYKVVKYAIQYIAVLAALLVGMSRVSDYKHHWSDVLAGLVIGSVSATVTGVLAARLFHEDDRLRKKEPNQNGNNAIV